MFRRVIGATSTLERRTYAAGPSDVAAPPLLPPPVKLNLGNFDIMVAELRAVAQLPQRSSPSKKKTEMPDTQFLKAIGRHDLVHAIRKKHGGFVAVAERLGWHIETTNARESHIKLATREKRRTQRLKELQKHKVF